MRSEGRRMDSDAEVGVLLHSPYPSAYFVQSPSTLSHANSAATVFPSPLRDDHHHHRLGYSSSRGSNNPFPNHNKGQNHRLIIVKECDGEGYYGNKGGWWGRYLSFRRSSSCWWICVQISWRLAVSLAAALLVFYLATKPPPPIFSIKIGGIRSFALAEGVDSSGVTTKILTCNASLNLLVDNNSKLFGLHIHPPLLEISFAHLPLAVSTGPKLYAERDGSTMFKLSVGTVKKPMYGAGRSMQDMLESGKGLPLVVRVSLNSNFRVVWNIIRPKFHHRAECVLLLDNTYDKKHRTQNYNSTCTLTS